VHDVPPANWFHFVGLGVAGGRLGALRGCRRRCKPASFLRIVRGFEPVGLRRRLGKMNYGPLGGHWRDVLLLERRSTCVGIG
jgi:hypothetical protein